MMASNMRTSRAGLDIIKAFEGFRPRYTELPDGRWVIGYGHVRKSKEGAKVSEDEAEAILREYDLPPVEQLVADSVLAPLNQNEFDALVSLAYNIGAKAFACSDVVAHINAGNRLASASAFDHWRRAKIGGRVQIVDVLVRRRAAEKSLFLQTSGQMPAASSRLYRAMHDANGLPTPPKAREILVEHKPEIDSDNVDGAQAENATEAAANAVRRRLVRIIGEDGGAISTKPVAVDTTDGASPEEITAAISALAGEPETTPSAKKTATKTVWPQREDLPPPPHLERDIAPKAERRKPPKLDPIDDTEEVFIAPDQFARATTKNVQVVAEEETAGGKGLDAAPFGLLALIGAGLGGYGAARQFGLVPEMATPPSDLAAYLPPFLILLGGLLFVVMAYYFFRTLFSRD
jgi:lysozyme